MLTDFLIGGHASEDIDIPAGVEVTKVEVGQGYQLNGLRFHLSNNTAAGYLYKDSDIQTLGTYLIIHISDFNTHEVSEPASGEKIIGFYGRSDWGYDFDGVDEFGIITAPKDVELPTSIYDLPELQNTDGGNGPRPVSFDC